MKVKIWSDVRCPFCYIGKKKFENALVDFSGKDEVEIEWKSYQLDPTLKTDPNLNTLEYFMKTKNVSESQAREMFKGATQMAEEVVLDFNLEARNIGVRGVPFFVVDDKYTISGAQPSEAF